MSNSESMKKQAALCALELVKDGMKLGLGTGSTARYFVDGLGAKVAQGLNVVCVPTSEATRAQAEGLGIKLASLDALGTLDLTIDGADELDDRLDLIKGAGGALLREKIVASASKRMVVIADASKHVACLGAFPLSIEVVNFSHGVTAQAIVRILAQHGAGDAPLLRANDATAPTPFITDNGNYIYDCPPMQIKDAPKLAQDLSAIAGVVEHGLFIGLADTAFVATADGVKMVKAK